MIINSKSINSATVPETLNIYGIPDLGGTYMLKREKLRDAGRLPKDSREQIVANINKVLTPEQQKQWAEMRRQAKEKYRNQ